MYPEYSFSKHIIFDALQKKTPKSLHSSYSYTLNRFYSKRPTERHPTFGNRKSLQKSTYNACAPIISTLPTTTQHHREQRCPPSSDLMPTIESSISLVSSSSSPMDQFVSKRPCVRSTVVVVIANGISRQRSVRFATFVSRILDSVRSAFRGAIYFGRFRLLWTNEQIAR